MSEGPLFRRNTTSANPPVIFALDELPGANRLDVGQILMYTRLFLGFQSS